MHIPMNRLNLKFLIKMAFVVTSLIAITSQKLDGRTIKFDFIHRGEIHQSWKNQTQTATLQFGKRIFIKKAEDKLLLQDVLSAGDKVSISFGYDNNLREEFTGFVTRFDARIPLSIFVEDNMWLLKKDTLNKSWASANLQEVIKYIITEYNKKYGYSLKFIADDADLGQFRLSDVSGAQALNYIRTTYGLTSYFRGDTLYCQLANNQRNDRPQTIRYDFQRNIISNNLEYMRAEDLKIKVRAIAFTANNKKEKVELGDPDGELHTYHYPLKQPISGLKKFAQAELDRVKYDGYRGSFVSFGIPYIQHGDIAQLIDNEFPDREGRFIVDSVTTQFGVVGIRRIIEPGRRA